MALSSRARVALVHDWLNQAGGAEVVLGVLTDLFPGAPVHTTICDPRRVPAAARWDVRASWIDRLPGIHAHHRPYLPLYPLAWEGRRIRDADLVLSNKSGFCHGVRTPGAVHVCYCLTPTRYVWDVDAYLAHEPLPAGARLALRALLPLLAAWDRAAARRVDHFVAISSVVRDRIRATYGRDSTVIHPPAELDRFLAADPAARPADAAAAPEDRTVPYDVVLARLVPYKRIDLAVTAYSRLGRQLVVVGEGRDRPRLEALAGPTVTFAGRLPDPAAVDVVRGARALVWPGVEDYGIAPVEAMAAGRPVIARRAGGVLDTVVEGTTGVFFDDPDPDALAAAVVAADAVAWDPAAIRRHARRFDRPSFERRLLAYLGDALAPPARSSPGAAPAMRASAGAAPANGGPR